MVSFWQAHLKEPRHVNYYRNMAYKDPKKRQVSAIKMSLVIKQHYWKIWLRFG